MKLKQQLEIQKSYEQLIKNCNIKIHNGIDVETNRILLNQYRNVLDEIRKKSIN